MALNVRFYLFLMKRFSSPEWNLKIATVPIRIFINFFQNIDMAPNLGFPFKFAFKDY